MSRLYDALKGAKGFREGTQGNAADTVWETLGMHGAAVAPAVDDTDVAPAQAADEVIAQDLNGVLDGGGLSSGVEEEASVTFGVPVKAAVGERIRLIPNAVDQSVSEHYRRLRTKIMQQREEKGFRSLLVASAAPQEGKTLTVLNLGLSFSTVPSFRVLVVDGDMRRGTLGKWLGADDALPGLSNLMDGSARLEEVVCQSAEIPMHFITRGNSRVPDLQSSQLQDHFHRMTEQYDLVVVDTPPVNLVADAQLLAASCEAVLLVARAYVTTRQAYEKAVQDLQPFHLIGTVLNAGTTGSSYRGYY